MVRIDRLATLRRALSNTALRRALMAYAASSLAEYAAYFTVILIAFEQGGPSAAGVAAAMQFVPSIAVPLIIKRIAPRLANPVRWSLLWLAGLLGLAAMLPTDGSLWVLVSVAALRSVGYSLARPMHLAVVPVHSASASDVTSGMVVTGWIDAGGAIGGPALAALVLGLSGGSSVFAVAALLAVLGAALSPSAGLVVGPRSRSGSASVLQLQGMRPLLTYKFVSAMMSGATDVIIVLVALQLLGLGQEGAGYLTSLIGVGELIGSLFLISLLGRKALTGMLGVSALGRGATLSLLGVVPQAVPLIVIGGGFRPANRVIQRLLLQRITPPDRYMQVFGVNEVFDIIGQAIGAIMVPLLVILFGLETSVVIAGALLPLVFVSLIRAFTRIDARSIVQPDVLAVLEDAPWLAILPDDVVEYLARTGEVETLAEGDLLISQGDTTAESAWIVLAGEFDVFIDGQPRARLGPTDLVGEMALLHGEPRNADVTARTAASVLRLDRVTFLDVLLGGRTGGTHVEAVASARAAHNEDRTPTSAE